MPAPAGFPAPPYPCAPLAKVTTAGGAIVGIEDFRVIDENRAKAYKNADDPANVVRYREGWFRDPMDGYIRWWTPEDDYFLKRRQANSPNLTIYPSLPRFLTVDGRIEARVEIDSETLVDDPDAFPSEKTVTLYGAWQVYTATDADGTRSTLVILGGTGETPFLVGGPDVFTQDGRSFSRLAAIVFHAVNRLDTSGLRDHTAGEILSIADAWTPFPGGG